MRAPKCGGFTPSPNPRDVSRARQRRSTWLGKLLPSSRLSRPSRLKGGREDLPYSCGTAPDSNRLRLFSPGIRTMGTPDVQYSVSESIQAGAGPVQIRLPRGASRFGDKKGSGGECAAAVGDTVFRLLAGHGAGTRFGTAVVSRSCRGASAEGRARPEGASKRRHRRIGGCAARGA